MKRYSHIFALNIVVETENESDEVTEQEIFSAIQTTVFRRLTEVPGHRLINTVYLKDTMELEVS